eukprot:snap_masked-scaffold244_size240795-processed-gene-1.17 protein:Tk02102 transcript:snap_masked-scaffold244_size240795-processed-gene-1.17-mRNA-1 annotation:"conserved hypothetical protein"
MRDDFIISDSDEAAPPIARSRPYFREPRLISSSSDEADQVDPGRPVSLTSDSASPHELSGHAPRGHHWLFTPTGREPSPQSPTPRVQPQRLVISSDSEPEPEFRELPSPVLVSVPVRRPPPVRAPRTKKPPLVSTLQPPTPYRPELGLSFLQSLSLPYPNARCHPHAAPYLTKYSSMREELTRRLFNLFNEAIFVLALPVDLEITWSPRLLKTAGRCFQRSKRIGSEIHRSSSIELSSKVLDSCDRLRDTLVHEMCHAASWVISGYRDGHGPIWKDWAQRCTTAFPELPLIARCHNYAIRTKYTYRCTQCGYQVGRHSKSLDTDRKVCGKCRGHFELLLNLKGGANSETPGRRVQPATPRAPNPFALFVKDHYKNVRTPGVAHKEAMHMLSDQFARTKIRRDAD